MISVGLAQTYACDKCGHRVSERYFAVFSVDGVLYSCRWCGVNADHYPPDESENTGADGRKSNDFTTWRENV